MSIDDINDTKKASKLMNWGHLADKIKFYTGLYTKKQKEIEQPFNITGLQNYIEYLKMCPLNEGQLFTLNSENNKYIYIVNSVTNDIIMASERFKPEGKKRRQLVISWAKNLHLLEYCY
jgi:hypothetical protein